MRLTQTKQPHCVNRWVQSYSSEAVKAKPSKKPCYLKLKAQGNNFVSHYIALSEAVRGSQPYKLYVYRDAYTTARSAQPI